MAKSRKKAEPKAQPQQSAEATTAEKVRSIEQVLGAESEAKRLVEEAGVEKQKLEDQSKSRASSILEASDSKATELKADIVNSFDVELGKMKQHYIHEAEKRIKSIKKMRLSKRDQQDILSRLADQILGA